MGNLWGCIGGCICADSNREHALQLYCCLVREGAQPQPACTHADEAARNDRECTVGVSDASALCHSFDYWINASHAFVMCTRERDDGLATKMHFYYMRARARTYILCDFVRAENACSHLFTAQAHLNAPGAEKQMVNSQSVRFL